MAELTIRFDIRFTPGMFRAGLAGLLVSVLATELASEQLTLTTYYPAPSGVYTKLLTTADAYFARDGGSVGVGTGSPSAPLHVRSSNDAIMNFQTADDSWLYTQWLTAAGVRRAWMGLDAALGTFQIQPENGTTAIVLGGNVGVGMTPGGKLSVSVPANSRGIESITATAGDTHLPWSDNWNYISGNGVIFRDASNVERVRLDATTGRVGVGLTGPQAPLDVNGTGIFRQNAGVCSVLNYVEGTTSCPLGNFVTTMSGVYVNRIEMGNRNSDGSGSALCCPYPGGSVTF